MPQFFLLALGLVLLLLLGQRLSRAEPSLLFKTIKWTVAGVLLLAAIYLTLVGRLLHVAALSVLLIFLLKSDLHAWLKRRKPIRALHAPLTVQEARRLLGVRAQATSDEIEDAFKQVKAKDSGHRDRLFQAKTLLLKTAKKQE